jgi:hypothetical protein
LLRTILRVSLRTVEKIELAASHIRVSEARQLESVHVITDAAILAAEQVQDKRLEVLEKGPEVSGFDIFLEFALTFVLESNLIGKSLKLFTKHLVSPRIQAKRLAIEATKTIQEIDSIIGRNTIELIERGLENQTFLRSEIHSLNRWVKILAVLDAGEGGVDAVLKAARAAHSKEKSGRDPLAGLEPSDTAGVTILDLAQVHASEQRVAIRTEHAWFEFLLRTGSVTPEQIYRMLQWKAPERSPPSEDNTSPETSGLHKGDIAPVSLGEMKDRWKRYFELLIWTLLLSEHSLTGKSATTPRQRFTLNDYVQPVLIRYWLKRFLDPKTERPFSETPELKRPDGKPDLDRSVAALGNYMWDIAKHAQKNKVGLVSSGPTIPKARFLSDF